MFERAMSLLEFDKIKQQLADHAATSLGREQALRLEPKKTLREVQAQIDETDEGAAVLRVRGHLPFGGISDIRAPLQRARIGGTLSAKELVAIAGFIRGSRILKAFLLDTAEERGLHIPHLTAAARALEPKAELEKAIAAAIDDQGIVLDEASEALRSIRAQIRSLDARIKDKLESIIRSSSTQKMLSEALVTIRGDRYVVPVKQEYRHAFNGIVHDQSASGATLFIEPQAVVELSNQLAQARANEKHEIERILAELSGRVGEVAAEIAQDVERLARIDFIFAKAKYARTLKAAKPALRDDGFFNLKKARHPLIPAEKVVPIDIGLGNETRAIIITGPNTGGKTVTLKTVGLLTLMAQSGLHIPADEGSVINVYERVFADIGDEQSIEQSLSTFSSHMTNIVSILKNINARSLALFDELGAGTDPQEGAALSIAILDDCIRRGAHVIATTHYSELKAYAYERPEVENASVEFDVATLAPTYRLLMGIPGRSNAFEISQRLGLPEAIIREAKALIGRDSAKIDQMIASLEKSRKEAERHEREAAAYREEMERLKQALAREKERFEREKEKRLQEAVRATRLKLEKAEREAQAIIAELRSRKEEAAESIKEHELIDAKARMEQAMQALAGETAKKPKPYEKEAVAEFAPGQEVKVVRFGQNGHVIEKINDREYLVQIGIMKMNIDAADLKPVRSERDEKPVVSVRSASTAPAKTELDLRGERLEDAMIRVEKFIDEALLAGYSRVSIIHGKGTGALRKGVHEKLKHHPHVKSIRLGAFGEGDSGVTIVELK